jgi:hypothetical protein
MAAAFATMVTPFLMSLNNHIPGTFSVLFAWYAVLRIWRRDDQGTAWDWVAAGLFSAFSVVNELPALAFFAAVAVLLAWRSLTRFVLCFLPPVLLMTAAYFGTNYWAIGQWKPAYSEFRDLVSQSTSDTSPAKTDDEADKAWYQYEFSHWARPRNGIDWARHVGESEATYALHVLVGHHGIFSLFPIWLIALSAMLFGTLSFAWWRGTRPPSTQPAATTPLPWFVQPLGLSVSVVVIGFYLLKSNNYGGWTHGPRWLMWLAPLWLTCMLPALDRLSASRLGRWLAGLFLLVSVLSVHYPTWSPWVHPWIYDLMLELGWPGYAR